MGINKIKFFCKGVNNKIRITLGNININLKQVKNNLNKRVIISQLLTTKKSSLVKFNSILTKVRKVINFLLPPLIYSIKKNTFKIIFVISVTFIINYCMGWNISSCESILNINSNNWGEVFFKLGLGCVGLTLFSYHVKPIGFI